MNTKYNGIILKVYYQVVENINLTGAEEHKICIFSNE